MNISGILVVVPPDRFDEAVAALGALEGVEVHHTDAATGRIVVTQEGATVGDEVAGLRRIKSLPFVTLAEMVYHHFEDSEDLDEGPPSGVDEPGGLPGVPPYLLNE